MPTIGDMAHFLGGQTFGHTSFKPMDLSGKTVIVTGANTGLGFEAAKHFAHMNISILILACRNLKKGEAAKALIMKDPRAQQTQVEVWEVDLSRYNSVLAFGERVRSLHRLDGFIANAGVEPQVYQTAEGLELTLTVNVVSTLLSAIAILPKLEQTCSEQSTDTYLNIVGSMVHAIAPDTQLDVPADRDILESLSDPTKADMPMRYNLSKLLLHQAAHEFAGCVSARAATSSHGGHEVIVNWVNPGWCGTELGRSKKPGLPQRTMFAMIGRTAEQGSRAIVHAFQAGPATHGKYLSECQIKHESSFMRSERGVQIQKRFWGELMHRIKRIDPRVAQLVQPT